MTLSFAIPCQHIRINDIKNQRRNRWKRILKQQRCNRIHTADHLIELGYGPSFAADIIKKAKELMVEKGHTYYQSRKLDRVPKEAVEELLGITLPDKQE